MHKKIKPSTVYSTCDCSSRSMDVFAGGEQRPVSVKGIFVPCRLGLSWFKFEAGG
jgi:hypothetical protein